MPKESHNHSAFTKKKRARNRSLGIAGVSTQFFVELEVSFHSLIFFRSDKRLHFQTVRIFSPPLLFTLHLQMSLADIHNRK